MKIRIVVAAAALVAFAVSGCSSPESNASQPSTPPPSTPTTTVEPSQTPEEPAPLTCDTLVTQSTLDEFDSVGLIPAEDYESDLRSEASVEAKFFDYGGLSCRWFLPNSDWWVTFGYSPINAEQAALVQAELQAAGFVSSPAGTDLVFSLGAPDETRTHNETYLFEDGAWFHSQELAGIDEIRSVIAKRR
ncbi:hypothetical protein [Homoserinimonas hongtaonis]|uniref:DUF3558 domain-containing protein n=1 Tax=Homoserinimonas hongtaonis TaxID=2079791 RepID=A0A2U1SX70_9MICO|nr:hypothetical protein [Salinibacterium hongtaonis]AWB88798.1 hypothetical protein C2138_03870 [Salinibacterium hongtaonis]PWB96199.1 hypothetical protein DF220_12580 [Salinibacterium hongtaonis]